ncbi:MAG: hypothetical protein N3B21_19420 [Clostridia bacterium]|nr:hypothetical protein [Clostridia bacterium]
MAKNWKVGEAVRAIQAGNKEDILDIGRRFPLFLNLASQVNEPAAKILDTIPEYVTARKVESVLKGETEEGGEGETTGEEKEVKDISKEEKKDTAKDEKKDPYAGKSAKDLYMMCKERKIEVETKQAPEVYIKALKADDKKKAEAAKKSETKKTESKKDEDDWGEEDKKDTKKTEKKEEKKDTKKDDDWDI